MQRECFTNRVAYIKSHVDDEMQDVAKPKSWQSRLWTLWFYIYYGIELEWDRYTPFFHPLFAAVLAHHAMTTLELSGVCIFIPHQLNYETDLMVCKKRDQISDECLKTEAITEKDIKRLEVFSFTTTSLFYVAQAIPFAVPVIYGFYLMKAKDIKI